VDFLSHISRFIQGEVVAFQVLLNRFQPCFSRTSRWDLLQSYGGETVKIFSTCASYGIHAVCRNKVPSHLYLKTSKVMVIVWRLRGNIIRTANVLPLQWAQLTKTRHTARFGLEFVFLCFLGCMICLYVGVCFVLPWTVESFPFMLWRWRKKRKWAPFELFAPSPLLQVRSLLHPF